MNAMAFLRAHQRASLWLAGVMALAIVFSASWLFVTRGSGDAQTYGEVRIIPATVDLGDIPLDGGKAQVQVAVTNVGNGSLRIHRLSTSCGCTEAVMAMDVMSAGESRAMTITFDPSVHPDVTGPIVRVVYLQTSDPTRPEVEIDVIGNVVTGNEL